MTEQEHASWQPVADQVRRLTETILWAKLPAEDVAEAARLMEQVNAFIEERAGAEPELTHTFASGRPVKDGIAHAYRRRSMVSSPEHPFAPPMHFEVDDDGNAMGTLRLSRVYQGPPGRCHGGYVAVILDHIFGATGAWTLPGPFYTKTLEVIYDAGVPLQQDLVVYSRVDRIEGRKGFISGEITCQGEVCARATGLLVMPKELVEVTNQ